MNDYIKTLCKVQVTLAIKIDSVDWQADNKGLEEYPMLSWTHRYHKGHPTFNHIQPPGWVTGYTFFSLKRQPCVFDIPCSSSGCLWAQGPTCLPQLLCFLIERSPSHVFYRLKKLSYSWFTWLTPTHSARFEKCTMFYTGEQVVLMTLLWLRNLGGKWQPGQYWTHLQYLPLFYNICLYYIYGLNHLKLITLYSKLNDWYFLRVILLHTFFQGIQANTAAYPQV